jgi:hypothetical protein
MRQRFLVVFVALFAVCLMAPLSGSAATVPGKITYSESLSDKNFLVDTLFTGYIPCSDCTDFDLDFPIPARTGNATVSIQIPVCPGFGAFFSNEEDFGIFDAKQCIKMDKDTRFRLFFYESFYADLDGDFVFSPWADWKVGNDPAFGKPKKTATATFKIADKNGRVRVVVAKFRTSWNNTKLLVNMVASTDAYPNVTCNDLGDCVSRYIQPTPIYANNEFLGPDQETAAASKSSSFNIGPTDPLDVEFDINNPTEVAKFAQVDEFGFPIFDDETGDIIIVSSQFVWRFGTFLGDDINGDKAVSLVPFRVKGTVRGLPQFDGFDRFSVNLKTVQPATLAFLEKDPVPSLFANPASVSKTFAEGVAITDQIVQLRHTGVGFYSWKVGTLPSWLSVDQTEGDNDVDLTFSFDNTNLVNTGSPYKATVTITAIGGDTQLPLTPVAIPFTVTITPGA